MSRGAQPIDATWTVSASVDDRLGSNVIFYLWLLPLVTAALGWAAAAATGRIRPRLAVSVAAVPFTVPGWMAEGDPGREEALPQEALPQEALPQEALPPEAGRADRGRSWRRTAYLLLLSAVVVAAVSGLALGMLR